MMRFLIIALLLVATPAFADRGVSSKDFSGWLDDYDSLVYVEDRNSFVFFNEAKRGKYQRVFLDSLVVYATDAEQDASLATEAAQYLRTGIIKLLEDKRLSADGPGDNTLTLKLAITGVEKSKEDLKPRNFVPVAAVFRVAQTATGKVKTYIDAMFEAEMTDSMSGDRVAAVVTQGISETEKKSGDELTFEDLTPTLDAWLERFSVTLKEYLAEKEG